MTTEKDEALALFFRLHECVRRYDADGQAELFAEDGVWELPFATDPVPRKIEGRENIRAFGRKGMEASKEAGRSIVGYSDVKSYWIGDDRMLVAEFLLKGEVAAQNLSYAVPYLQLLKTTGGRIALLRDYFPMERLKNLLARP